MYLVGLHIYYNTIHGRYNVKLNQANNTIILVSANSTTYVQTSRKIDSKPSSLRHNCERRGKGVMVEMRRINALNSRINRIYLFHRQSEVANLFIGCPPQSNNAVTMDGIIDHLNWLTFHSSERVHQRHVYNILPISNPNDPLRRILMLFTYAYLKSNTCRLY